VKAHAARRWPISILFVPPPHLSPYHPGAAAAIGGGDKKE